MSRKAHDLFTQAVVLEPALREVFVAENCPGDEALQAEVMGMLAEAERADSLFDWDDAEVDTVGGHAMAGLEKEGDVIGPYTLRQKLGEGGFGTVWMAEQSEPISRMVALKIVKAGMDTRQVLARFEAERQALAMMEHPNIARVIDAGATQSGRPYFAMELVKGIPITEFCRDQNYDARRCLELFKKVCSAVNHAHQKGVIHRDLKPSNVMVTLHGDEPVPKVIDFGIAKATQGKLTDQTLFTRYEQFLGTPAYMSPEQTAMSGLDIDTRADIYSLGILLYEMLAGQPPFDAKSLLSAGYEEMRRIIREEEPPKPSTRLTQTREEGGGIDSMLELTPAHLKGDLDWIVLKAIDKDRSRRYETANAFASDIERYLGDQPVEAAAPTTRYRLRKFVRRNRTPIAVATAIASVLVIGSLVSLWQAAEARAAEREARKAVEVAESRLGQANKANQVLASVFSNLDPESVEFQEKPMRVLMVENLEFAIKELDGDAIGDPLVTASMQYRLAVALVGLGEPEKAIPLLEKAVETMRANMDPNELFLTESMSWLARALGETGNHSRSLELFQEVLRLREEHLGKDDLWTITALVNVAKTYAEEENHEQAIPLLEKADQRVRGARESWGEQSGKAILDVPSIRMSLAVSYAKTGRLAEAIPLARQVILEMEEASVRATPASIKLLEVFGAMLTEYAAYDEGIEYLEAALPAIEKIFGADHQASLPIRLSLASAYVQVGKLDEAIELRKHSLEIAKARLGLRHRLTLAAMMDLGVNQAHAGQYQLAAPLIEEARRLADEALPREDRLRLRSMYWHAHSDYWTKETGALSLAQETLELQEEFLGSNDGATIETMGLLSHIHFRQGDLQLALQLSERAVELSREHFPSRHPILINSKLALVSFLKAKRDYQKAISILEEMLAPVKENSTFDRPGFLRARSELAHAYWATGKSKKAIPLFEQSVAAHKAHRGGHDQETLLETYNLVVNYKAAGQHDKAIERCEEIVPLILDGNIDLPFPTQHPVELSVPLEHMFLEILGIYYYQAKKHREAIPIFEKNVEILESAFGRKHQLTNIAIYFLALNFLHAGILENSKQSFKKAIPLFQEAIDSGLMPTSVGGSLPYTNLYSASLAAGEYETAGEIVNEVREENNPGTRKYFTSELPWICLTLVQMELFEKAEPLARELLEHRLQEIPDQWPVYSAKALLGRSLLGQGNLEEAEGFLIDGVEGLEKFAEQLPASAQARLPEAMKSLISFYEKRGEKGDAEKAKAVREKLKTRSAGQEPREDKPQE